MQTNYQMSYTPLQQYQQINHSQEMPSIPQQNSTIDFNGRSPAPMPNNISQAIQDRRASNLYNSVDGAPMQTGGP
jgi:hypothetical protein